MTEAIPAHAGLRKVPVTIAAALAAGTYGAAAGLVDTYTAPGGVGVLLYLALAAGLLIMISVVDIREHRIPDQLVVALGASTSGRLAAHAATGHLVDGAVATAFTAAIVLGLLYFGGGIFGIFGLGDVKLAAALGLLVGALGGTAWMLVPVAAILIGGIHTLIRRGFGRSGATAHGPALAAAGVVAILAGLS